MSDNKKICFISCVNNDLFYEECLKYIQNLIVPAGYTIDIISIKDAKSMCEGYNAAMEGSDAKYKVYLHQDTFIINKNFISDILKLFNSNKKIGMLGLCGAETIPTSAVWWDSIHKYGKVYENHTGEMKILAFNEVDENYHNVKTLDGLIMVTQYDLPWREDIFNGWHFYDLSQCTEFTLAGYEIVIPNQNTPWCIHDCGLVETKNGFEKYKNVYLDEYSKKIFPLVSIMITAYNRPEYFKIALESAINQNYKNIEIIICDNSTNDECKKVAIPYLDLHDNIKYYKNEKELEVIDNFNQCIDLAAGEYICFLMDDDIYNENKISDMIPYLIEFDDVSLVTSYRQVIDGDGNKLNPLPATSRLFDKVQKVEGKTVQEFVLKNMLNVIGETTTPLFRKKDINQNKFGVLFGRQYRVISDLVTWIGLLSKGNLVYLPNELSYFRLHSGQDQQKVPTILRGANEWFYLIKTFLENKLIDENNYKKILKTWLRRNTHILNKLEEKQISYNAKLEKEFLDNYEYAKSVDKVKIEMLISSDCNSIKNVLPLVSILIPAYNQTKYLKEALESAINQTYPNIEIIIGDDSTNDDVRNFLEPYLSKYCNITYFKNQRDTMDYGLSNVKNLLKKSNGEYVNYLNHDDVFHTQKIEKMMNCFIENEDITVVTSVRQLIDTKGKKLPLNGAFKRLFEKDTVVSGLEMSRFVIKNLMNCIGEPTTILFKKSYIDNFGEFNGKQFFNLMDVAVCFKLLQHGNIMYLSEALSYFRIHPNQNSNNMEIKIKGIVEWGELITESYRTSIIYDFTEYKATLYKWIQLFLPSLDQFINCNNVNIELKNKLKHAYKYAINQILH